VKHKIEYKPEANMQGHWVVYEEVAAGWWAPIASRSSHESAQAYLAERFPPAPARQKRKWFWQR
jgi:hypothetical protein